MLQWIECFWENSEFGRTHGKKRQNEEICQKGKFHLTDCEFLSISYWPLIADELKCISETRAGDSLNLGNPKENRQARGSVGQGFETNWGSPLATDCGLLEASGGIRLCVDSAVDQCWQSSAISSALFILRFSSARWAS